MSLCGSGNHTLLWIIKLPIQSALYVHLITVVCPWMCVIGSDCMSVSAFYGCVWMSCILCSLIQCWSFSRVFEGISSWSFTESPAVCAHLAECPVLHAFAKSYDPTMPWKLSGLGQSLHKKTKVRSSPSLRGRNFPSETSSEEDWDCSGRYLSGMYV